MFRSGTNKDKKGFEIFIDKFFKVCYTLKRVLNNQINGGENGKVSEIKICFCFPLCVFCDVSFITIRVFYLFTSLGVGGFFWTGICYYSYSSSISKLWLIYYPANIYSTYARGIFIFKIFLRTAAGGFAAFKAGLAGAGSDHHPAAFFTDSAGKYLSVF